ncbi:hypothetical protein T484DRAFT_3635742 [Baffinella frigidus]|nr:hypothetical protein T484DRAFT_3635742 [Cryptophyta sp. CCMP2293]
MATKSLESVGPKIVDGIIQLRKSQSNITQSAKGVAIHVNDAQDYSIPVEKAWEEKTQTDSKLIPASPQVLFSAGFLPTLDDIITQLIALTKLANDCNQRNSAANTDVDTLETTALRLQFLSLAGEHAMCWKAVSGIDTRGISFSSNGDNMIRFREQFLKKSLEDMVTAENAEKVVAAENAEKVANGQATTYTREVVNMKTFDTTLEKLTKLTNCLKSSKYYQDAKPEDTLDAHRWGIVTSTITTVEEIVTDMRQVSFTPTDAYTPDTKVKTMFVTHLLSFFYCADNVNVFENAVQTSALLVTTTAITGKGAAGDKQMKEYFYDFIAALFGATKKQTLKQELDKKAGMFERKSFKYYTIDAPSAEIAYQLIWSKEVRQKAADLFSQKAVRVLEHALEDTTPRGVLEPAIEVTPTHNPLKPVHQKVDKVLREWDPVQPASERETIALRPPSGRTHTLVSVFPPASPMPTPPTETPGRKLLAPISGAPQEHTPIQQSHRRVPLKAPTRIKGDPDV